MAAPTKHFLSYIETSIKQNANCPALSDYDGDLTYTYAQMAEKIASGSACGIHPAKRQSAA